MRYIMDFSYSGQNFSGYQIQPNKRTVQEEIQKVLTSINGGNKVIIYSSGRTDSKVNALHQIAHFNIEKKITLYKLKKALNSYLPDDIYINDVKSVSDDFHARYMVKSKTYVYKINTGCYNPLFRNFVYQYCKKLNVPAMQKAVKKFVGTYDFTTFASKEDRRENKIRTIYDASLSYDEGIVTISFNGNGFLKYQVRNMVGFLIKVGENKLDSDDVLRYIKMKNRELDFPCAPAYGLTLLKVDY